jgi:NADH-quinone oxidoreductase subunit E
MSEKTILKFSEETAAIATKIVARYPEGRHKSALIPLLHLAQAECVAEFLSIQPIEAYEVASFYSMFNLKPVGKCTLEVCRTSSCWLNGAEDVVRHIEKKLGIKEGQTTADGMFTLKTVECLGSCGTAPMLQCGGDYYENLTLEKTDNLLEALRADGKARVYTNDNPVNID